MRIVKKGSKNKKERPQVVARSSNKSVTWEQFLGNKSTREILKQSWKAPNPQQHYEESIKSLHKVYSNGRKNKPAKNKSR